VKVTTTSDIITHKVLNEKTGELESTDFQQVKKSKNIRGGFRMVYKSYDEAVEDIISSKLDFSILICIRDKFTYAQKEHNLSAMEISEDFKVSRQKVTTIISKAVKAGLLKKSSKSLYRLNPFMYVPYRADGSELQAEWNELKL
jgi:predicted transcriptional regulator